MPDEHRDRQLDALIAQVADHSDLDALITQVADHSDLDALITQVGDPDELDRLFASLPDLDELLAGAERQGRALDRAFGWGWGA